MIKVDKCIQVLSPFLGVKTALKAKYRITECTKNKWAI